MREMGNGSVRLAAPQPGEIDALGFVMKQPARERYHIALA